MSFIKNILIISSEFTGHGHKSITDSLTERFSKYPDVKIHVVDGFSLGGNILVRIGKMYGTITRNAKELWKIIWEISIMKPSLINEFIGLAIEESFIKQIKLIKPDLILSVHPNFNGCIIDLMEKRKIKIPFGTLLADLVSIYPLWADPRADFIICPTEDSYDRCIEFGVKKEKLYKIGLPVRSRFCKNIDIDNTAHNYTNDRPLECLIMSGGEGAGNMSRIAQILLKNFNCNVSIIAGRNKVMKARLENNLNEKFNGRVTVHGFVTNIEELMINSDIAFTRGSPNVMMEAVMCNTPLVITGALPGQEEGNPEYFEKYNLGVICNETTKLKSTVSKLIDNNAKLLNDIKKSQRDFRDPMIAEKIVDFLYSVDTSNKFIPIFPRKKRNLTNPQELFLHTKATIRKARTKRRLSK